MEALLQLILLDPEAFQRSEVPCCLQGIWEIQLESLVNAHAANEPMEDRVSPAATARLSGV